MVDKHNPIVGVGALVQHEGKVLLVQRGNPPYQGQWCIPGGKVRFGESLQQAVEREILEEAGIVVKAREPIFCFDIIDSDNQENPLHYVVIDLLAEYVSGEIRPGSDAPEVAWMTRDEINACEVQETTRRLLERWWSRELDGI